MTALRKELIALTLWSATVGGCGDDAAGRCPEGTMPRGDGCVMLARDGSVPDDDAGPGGSADGSVDAGPPCMSGAEDPPDGIDQDCDGFDGRFGDRVFVSLDGDDTNLGTPEDPVRTIARALELDRPVLVLAMGTYEEDVTIASVTRSINGGYLVGPIWQRSGPRSTLALVDAPLTYAGVVGRDEQLTLTQMEVHGPEALEPGESSIAIAASTGTLRLLDSRVVAGRGAPGVDGSSGSPGLGGRDGREGLPCAGYPSCSAGVAPGGAAVTSACETSTVSGAGGESGSGGRSSPTGAGGGPAPPFAGAGGDGEDGLSGDRGGDGDGGDEVGAFSMTTYTPSAAPAGSAGSPGQGGGGGGGGRHYQTGGCSPATTSVVPPGAGGGSGGAGGCPGPGGRGGGGGGASVAIVASTASVVLERSEILTEGGGRGGRGGPGGPGGPGGSPGAGGARLCSTEGYLGHPGGAGGRGGSGGDGGHGGGGMGGPSIGLALRNGATWEGTETSFEIGAGGLGGASDGNPGSAGPSMETFDVP